MLRLIQRGARARGLLSIWLATGLLAASGCESRLWRLLANPSSSEQGGAIEAAFAARGLAVSRTRAGHWRCTTRHFDFIFPATFAGTVLDLAGQADDVHERMTAWFPSGGGTRRISVRVKPLVTGRDGSPGRGILVAGSPRPGVCEAPLPALMDSPSPDANADMADRRAARHVFGHRVAHVFINRHVAPELFQRRGWWFREGLAGYMAAEADADREQARLILAEVAHATGPLALDELPASLMQPAWRDYRAALSFFLCVRAYHGEAEVRRIVLSALNVGDVGAAGVRELETEWRGILDEIRRSESGAR
ncbi:hypothetical protein CMK11_06450 [Candidatus Poribacteria bacterium]|nr:hypothetical protein [Candidatus Poribacteria bacterium]